MILGTLVDRLTSDYKSNLTNCERKAGFQGIYSDHVTALSAMGC